MKTCRRLTRLLVMSLALAGCALNGGKPIDNMAFEVPKEVPVDISDLPRKQHSALLGRVEEKWRAMEQWDFATVYEYTTPNYRKVYSKSMFLNRFGYDVRWELTGIEVTHYDAQAAVASVAVRVMSKPAKQIAQASEFGSITDTVKEKWFLIDGVWWNNAK